MSIATEQSVSVAERAAAHFGLRPREPLDLTCVDGYTQAGEGTVLVGPDLDKAVAATLGFDDGEQPGELSFFYAFARPASLVPHLAIEWFDAGPDVILHLDLLPRLDVAVNPEYLREVYGPLTAPLAEARALPGVAPDPLPPMRAAGFSPWLLSVRGPAELAPSLATYVDIYVDHWFALTSGGIDARVDPVANDPAKLVQRDKFHRNALFDADADPIWSRVTRRIGPDRAAAVRAAYRVQEMR